MAQAALLCCSELESRAPVHCAGPCWELKWLYFDPLTLLSTEVTYILTLHRAENWSDYIWPCTVLRTEVVSSGGSPGVHLGVIWGVTWGVIWGVTWGVIWGVTWRSSGGHLGVYVCVCMYIYTRWPFPRPSNLTLSSRSLSSLSLSSLSLSSLSPWGDPYNFFLNAFCFCHGLLLIMSRQKQNALIDFAKCILLLSLTAADLLSPQKVKSSN